MRPALRLVCVGACSVSVIAADCGHMTTVVHEYPLTACPADGYDLPVRVEAGNAALERVDQRSPEWCPVFRGYYVGGDSVGYRYTAARLVRGDACRFEFSQRYMRGSLIVEGERSPDAEEAIAADAAIAARLLAVDAGVTLASPTSFILWDDFDADTWCEAALAGEEWAVDGDDT